MGAKGGGGMNEDVRRVIEDALCDLSRAANALVAVSYTHPWTPIPRPREFRICREVCWPKIENGEADFLAMYMPSVSPKLRATCKVDQVDYISANIVAQCTTPHELITALYNIRAATAWCEARAAGRLRQAQEVLRQRRSK